jgi:hypothetical protein
MRRFAAVGLAIAIIPVLVACRSIGNATGLEFGSGNLATETREVGAFDQLDVSTAVHATVTIGQPMRVSVTADDNLLDNVKTTVDGDKLAIGMSGSVSSSGNVVQVEITVPSLSAIHAGSAAAVDVQGLAADQLRLEADSAGRITASGTAPTLDLRAGSAGELQLRDLAVDHATVSIDSAGHAWLHATQAVTGSVSSAGMLTLVGKPATVDVSTDLTGSVVQQ